jgi:hypothetical protein
VSLIGGVSINPRTDIAIEVDKLAVIVDPLKDSQAFRRVIFVIKDGVVYKTL